MSAVEGRAHTNTSLYIQIYIVNDGLLACLPGEPPTLGRCSGAGGGSSCILYNTQAEEDERARGRVASQPRPLAAC